MHAACCREFKYAFSRAASVGENIEFLRELLRQLKRCVCVLLWWWCGWVVGEGGGGLGVLASECGE